jgi:tRNA wybutosine-synthesizing protein 4
MLNHFAKQTPLQSVLHYPTLKHQENRFLRNGYLLVEARSLWDFWEDEGCLSTDDKIHLTKVEPFDEWEEFILFASHYVILKAAGTEPFNYNRKGPARLNIISNEGNPSVESPFKVLQCNPIPRRAVGTRFVGALKITSPNPDELAIATPTNIQSTGSRSWTIHSRKTPAKWPAKLPLIGLSCYTLTYIGRNSSLLVGGRTSPSKANYQCFIYDNVASGWIRVHNLEPPRYRHSAIPFQNDTLSGVLVFGGQTGDGKILSDWSLWTEQSGWINIACVSVTPNKQIPVLFGASLTEGVLLGGIDSTFRINKTIWRWSIEMKGNQSAPIDLSTIKIIIHSAGVLTDHESSARVGTSLIQMPSIGLIMIGGVAAVPLTTREELVRLEGKKTRPLHTFRNSIPRPLLIGSVVTFLNEASSSVLITGGGGVCFSFGSCFNDQYYILSESEGTKCEKWVCFADDGQSKERIAPQLSSMDDQCPQVSHKFENLALTDEYATECKIEELHSSITKCLEPKIVRQLDCGPCRQRWSLDYLNSKVGSLQIAIHEGESRYLTFVPHKSFQYRTCEFSEFVSLLKQRKHVYLRALASNASFKEPANFWRDFSDISDDFIIPEIVQTDFNLKDSLHSAVLRISGDVSIWIHYDVMSNFYFQIQGSKTFLLFPPREALKLQFMPGNTASPLDCRSNFRDIPHKVVCLEAGDVLYIPRFWAHTTVTSDVDSKTSAAVNVFWRDLGLKYYAVGRDVYGNRDLAVYERGREIVQHVAKLLQKEGEDSVFQKAQILSDHLLSSTKLDPTMLGLRELQQLRAQLKALPQDVSDFYLPRLADELIQLVSK